jgi:hypothetical protein
MTSTSKQDLREQAKKARPHATTNVNDVEFAGDENRKVMPSSGRITSPDPGNVVEGQNSKSN